MPISPIQSKKLIQVLGVPQQLRLPQIPSKILTQQISFTPASRFTMLLTAPTTDGTNHNSFT
jgi:hypothetical protein